MKSQHVANQGSYPTGRAEEKDVVCCVCLKRKEKVFVTESYLTLYNPMDCSLPGSSVLGFPRQGYWSGLPFLSPGDLPDPGIKPVSPALQADSLLPEPPGKPKKG